MYKQNRLLTRALIISSLIVAALSGVGLAQPVLHSFSFTPTSINTSAGPANVTVNFSATDASNIYYFEMAFIDPTGVFVQRGIKSFTPSTSVTDSVTVAFPRFSTSGTWKVLAVYLADTTGQTLLLDTAGVAALGFPTDLQVLTTAVDTTPPNITSFSFSPATIDTTSTSPNVTVNFTATDNLAGVASVYVGFVSPSSQIVRGTRVNAPADFTSGLSVTSSFAINFPKGSETGTWKVSFINVVDGAGNTLFLDTAAAAAQFPAAQNLTVTATIDTTAPNLASFSFSPSTITSNGGTVTVNFTVTDDLSGATDFETFFQSPSGTQIQSGFATSPGTTSFTGSTTLTFPPGTEEGTWTTATIYLADASGNTRIISQPISLTVTPPGADTTPPVIMPNVSPMPNGASWNNTLPVTVTWAVADPESGIATSTGCGPTTFTAPTTGTTLTCSATNGAGLSNSASVAIKIDTAPPVTSNALATPDPVIINTDVTITATVTDAGGSNIASAEFNVDGGPFDDLAAVDGAFGGSTENVSLTLPASATPLLQTPGVHNICIRATDFADNIGATQCVLFAVYDPNGGFATGGGGNNSPAGADLANPTGSGPATFAFNPKYLPNNPTVPHGDLEYHYNAGNIVFKSTGWDFLVVTNGNRAQAQGTGTINGSTVCKFSLDAWNSSFQPGNVDAFGLTIFDCAGGSGNRYVLPTAPITKGSIKIHN